jgi:hypothetical protein
MSLVNQQLSQSWSEGSGSLEGPFDPNAIQIHNLSMSALAELVKMLKANDFQHPTDSWILLPSYSAESFLYTCGEGCYNHDIYFQYGENYFRLSKSIAGGGLEQRFQRTLQSFDFADK